MSYVKSFKELDRKLRCFSFAGAKVDTFHNMTKLYGNFFKRKTENFKYTLYNIYMGAKRRQKSIAKGNTAEFKPKKLARKYTSRNTEKKGVKRACHAWQIFFPRHVNGITSGGK
jgi:hypothetical protein